MTPIEIILYFIAGAVFAVLLGLVGINILMLLALVFGLKKLARGLQDILDKFAWPLRLGGTM